jgi:hypothetical protein
MRNTTASQRRRSQQRREALALAEADVEAMFGQINAATANGFKPDPQSPADTDDGVWYRTERSRLVLRGLDGAALHVFDGPIDAPSWLAFSIRFDGNIPAEVFEAAIRGAM